MRRNKIISFVLGIFLLFNISGCIPLIIGAAVGGVGIYAVSRDTIQAETDKPYEAIWDAAIKVSRIRGTIKKQEDGKGVLELEAESSRVFVRLSRITHATTRIRVSARKYHMPNIALAQDLCLKILEEAQ